MIRSAPPLTCLMILALVACFGAGAPWGLSHGLLFGVAGLLMLLMPPAGWSARMALCLAAAWMVPALTAFLPSSVLPDQPWRDALAAVGITLADSVSPQPEESWVMLMAMAAAGMVAAWALGHGSDDRTRVRAASWLVWGMVLFTLTDAWIGFSSADGEPRLDFGFFPNRNHSACLLSMATMVALGLTVQQVRWRQPIRASVSAVALLLLGGSLIARSPSRAGIVLLAIGLIFWWAMLGNRYLRGHASRTVWLATIAAALTFVVIDSVVKNRWDETLETIGTQEFASRVSVAPPAGIDARVGVARDTLTMISSAPWTGHGAGQFRFVFPQYREASADTADRDALHPESSWLWLAAETGVPGAFLLMGALIAMLSRAWCDIRHPESRGKALRAGCLAAACLPAIHGWIDVPLHRVGILWAAIVLVALAMSGTRPQACAITRIGWRGAGIATIALAMWLLQGSFHHAPQLPSERMDLALREAEAASLQDRKQRMAAEAQGIELSRYAAGQDPLEQRIAQLQKENRSLPMHAAAQSMLGFLALHFDDQDDLARQAFAAHRALDPRWIALPLNQAEAWSAIDEATTVALWREALDRARWHDDRWPNLPVRASVESQIREMAARSEGLRQRADILLPIDPPSR
jgi:hypothetical protein